MRQFVLHAHFYQPERLNPWTGVLEPEPSAAPDRDWNERILRESYRPNATARIFDESGRIERIVNNYERLSFNFGPTLLSWMEQTHPRTYSKIIDGDWRSASRTGYGNALAQAYNHMILPLANDRDRHTQLRWGLTDFRHRFGRDADGLWLPETAVDAATIDALIDNDVAFTILAPAQAARVRERGAEWRPVQDDLDTGRAYRHYHSDGSGRWLAVFFYDGALSQALAFDQHMSDAHVLLDRLGHARSGLVHAAVDGETFGHHRKFGELGLAYALFEGAEQRGLEATNYAAWLGEHPPVDEVEVVAGEGSAWSCPHGVGRWYRDCGCATDSEPGWTQQWRGPLRDALDIIRDAATDLFEERGASLLRDPWDARDDSINIRLGRCTAAEFLRRHATRSLSDREKVDVWTLLESQRLAMVMYTSCGWFFSDVSGIETVYVLRFAARALDLLEQLGLSPRVRTRVVAQLAEAKSNKAGVGTGADVWRTDVATAAVTPTRVAAHLSLLSLVRPLASNFDAVGHHITVREHRSETRGRLGLATSRMFVSNRATGRGEALDVAAVHLGGLDFHGVVSSSEGSAFERVHDELWLAFPTAPVARLIRLVAELTPGEEFGLEQMLPEGRQEVVGAIFSDLRVRFQEQYARLYHDHRRILEMLTSAGYDLPRELRAAAELTLSAVLEEQLAAALAASEADAGPPRTPEAFAAVRRTVVLARAQGYKLDLEPVARALADIIAAAAHAAARSLRPDDVDEVERWLVLGAEVGADLAVTRAQEHAYEAAARARAGRLGPDEVDAVARLGGLLGLSRRAWSTGA